MFKKLCTLTILSLVAVSTVLVAEDGAIKIDTYEDCILFAGYGYPIEFDPSLIKDEASKKAAFEKGLKKCEEMSREGCFAHQEILAVYYSHIKDFKKSLYWANKCAEQGSSRGMHFLAYAYINGEGILQDLDEGLKWLFLAVASGNEGSINWLHELKENIEDFNSNERVMQCKKNAQDWIKEHPKAFFNPD